MSGDEGGPGELDGAQRAVGEALLDVSDDREYFIYLTNRGDPLAGPWSDLSELSWDMLSERFPMGYTNLWILRRHAVYANSEWVELPAAAAAPDRCDGPDSPHFVLLAMGDWPGAPDPWLLARGGDCCTAAEARQTAEDMVTTAQREGLRNVPPLLCALRLHNHTWH